MHRSLGDMKIKKVSRHSGQRFLLIRNDRQGRWKCNRIVGTILAHSTTYWIPGQARYDGL